MKFSYNWLKELSGSKVTPQKMAEILTLHSFEARVLEQDLQSKGGGRGSKKSLLKNDTILDIDILPNRAHEGFSHISVAREIAAILGLTYKVPQQKVKEDKHLETNNFVSIKIANANACPRYAARFIEGVKVGPSPIWLKSRLETLGLNSINNIVDVTNYVMLEMGQPLHAFDAQKVVKENNRHTIFVRASRPKEVITTLDAIKRQLPQGILLIADAHKPLAIAGIKGGEGSEITTTTRNIIIEAANFNPNIIRHATKELGIITDASVRFSQNISPDIIAPALDRAVYLIQKVAGGVAYKGIAQNYPHQLVPRRILFDTRRAQLLCGVVITLQEVKKIFERLGFEAEVINPVLHISHIVERARSLVGVPYKYGASTSFDAPRFFDCSSFIKYLYREIGIELPRVTINQIEMGRSVSQKELQPGDLIFTKGSRPHITPKYPSGVGHVALYSGDKKVIHAAGGDVKRVIEEPLNVFLKKEKMRGMRRIIDKSYNREFILVCVPTIRLDIEQEEDLVEEVARIKGYNNLISSVPVHELVVPQINESISWIDIFKKFFVGLGFDELYNIVFVSKNDIERCGLRNNGAYIEVANPLNTYYTHLRPTLFISLLNNVRDNARFFDVCKIFEVGKIYQRNIGKEPMRHEKFSCAGVVSIKGGNEKEMFFETKGMLDGFFEKAGLADVWYDDYKPHTLHDSAALWQEGICAEIKSGNKSIGFVGMLRKDRMISFDIKVPVCAFELNIDALISLARTDRKYEDIPKYPSLMRDISVLVPLDTRVVEITNIIEPLGGALLENSDLIDSYEGGGLPDEQQSLTFRLVFRSQERTLSDEEVNKIMGKINSALKRKGWEIR